LLADRLDDRGVLRDIDELAPDKGPGKHGGDADGGPAVSHHSSFLFSGIVGRDLLLAMAIAPHGPGRKRLTVTKTMPVTQNVSTTVSSMVVQFDAMGVNHHGLAKWNIREPTTRRTRTTAIAIGSPLVKREPIAFVRRRSRS
jgi:hypothetical protein